MTSEEKSKLKSEHNPFVHDKECSCHVCRAYKYDPAILHEAQNTEDSLRTFLKEKEAKK